MLGAAGVGILWGAKIQDGLERLLRPITLHDSTGLTSFLPTAGRFRIYSVTGSLPGRSEAEYRLKVDGLVDRPTTLDLADLRTNLPQTKLTRDFQCVTGWRVPKVRWNGVRLSALLDAAGVLPGAAAVQFRSFDGAYTESLTLRQARRPDVLVVDTLDGKPISRQHGGPVRMLVAPMYGYKSCKWLSEIRVMPQLEPGYWEQFGYAQDGWVGRSNGRSDDPT
jgi:DMSO/TMAO reductase YedYZ molybdopterin-dependent catalytic subunit